MHVRIRCLAITAFCLLNACAQFRDFDDRRRSSRTEATAVQALIGATFLDSDLDAQRVNPNDPTQVAEADISQTPMIGIYGHQRLTGKKVEFGFEGGLLFSWWRDDASVRAGNGSIIVLVDNELTAVDISAGAYVSARVLDDNVRLYAGAGPLMLFANIDSETEVSRTSDSAFGVGGYARAGAELAWGQGAFLGFGVRGFRTNVDFDTGVPDVDLNGVQAMLTYTQTF